MFYVKSDGRLYLEAGDIMLPRSAKTIRSIRTFVRTSYMRPTTKSKTSLKLEKSLSELKLKFTKSSSALSIKRLLSPREIAHYVKTAVVYTVAASVSLVLFTGTLAATDIRFASEAIIDGKSVGVIADRGEFEELTETLRDSLSITLGEEVEPLPEPTYILRLTFGRNLTSAYELRQNVLTSFSGVVEAYALYSDNKLVCAVMDKADIETALEQLKAKYSSGTEGETVEFSEELFIRDEVVPVGYLCSAQGVMSALQNTKEEKKTYTVAARDTLWSIAKKFDMTVDELYAANENLSETIHEDDVLIVEAPQPLISVKTSYVAEGEQLIPYSVKTVSDNTMNMGQKKIVTKGVEGKKHVVEKITKINGSVTEREVQSETVISEPVTQVIKVGTKKSIATGSFTRPVYGTVTSRYGYRSRGYHTGIDIATSTGTAIVAADGGTVSTAGWSGGYGYLVVINHGNGYQTYYAHCSKLLVSRGQKVSKGQTIARVGSTGNSTGPHLHFEVRKNGSIVNPASFIGL